jgi:coenzyme F420-reducing hydrogenase beta subunit
VAARKQIAKFSRDGFSVDLREVVAIDIDKNTIWITLKGDVRLHKSFTPPNDPACEKSIAEEFHDELVEMWLAI